MTTTPPEQQPTERMTGAGASGYGGYGRPGTNLDFARLPIPGNAELVFFVVLLALLAIIAGISDDIDIDEWWLAAVVLGAAYLLSRGIAKASRVLEH